MAFVYILSSLKTNAYYVGSCHNIEKRYNLHNVKRVRSTKANAPWVLKYSEEYKTLSEARKREKQIKSWKKRSAIENLINRGSTKTKVGP